uniref:AIR synthase family protein n=1 Tax=Agathobacter sp. TaxID=2021311 RepID=UPI004056D555
MRAGKLKESILKRSVLKQLHKRNDRVICHPSFGGDFGAVEPKEGEVVVLSTDPITLAKEDIAPKAVTAALNDVACSGAKPVGILVNLLLPTGSNEQQLKDLIKEIEIVCEACNVDVIGGHTEVTRAVQTPLITVMAAGVVLKEKMLHSSNVRPGMDIIATKWVALEGTAILAKEQEALLHTRYSRPFVDNAKLFGNRMSVLPEAAVAMNTGAAAMHDVSEGGIFAALWELAESSGVGLEIDIKKIPIKQESVEICEFFHINPYKIVSGGCLLIAAEDGNRMVRELEKAGIHAVVIGKATDSNDRVLLNEEECRFLETVQVDELHSIIFGKE